ncbi:tetracycline regulation of excision, RteC [Niastella caeni]|uniref:Tetracycline regulation of excision, RteC n=1 Tax=Niastella caeni TaxID=2569763 RepID=A0A4S8HW36_9BACT|nr:RteC domain-containing protein [Niastella caeni]THU38264.1 tetracycline regulation of excision, RteC [Niastella caeni]
MPAFQSTFEELTQSWQLRLQDAEAGEPDLLTRVETCIHICEESLLELRQWVMEHSFPGRDCEIYFFKQVKPVIMARYIYYQKIYRLHIGYFNGSGLLAKERMERELQTIARYFADNADFYTYYRMGYTHHDELYFVRGAYNWKICPEVNHFDGIFSTSGDGKLAELMANELLVKYIDTILNPSLKLTEPATVTASRPAVASTLQCTASLTDIVELGYALQNCGFFNHGKASIKEIMALLADAFKVDLQKSYHLFLRLRARKNPAKFLDELKAALLRHIESDDD